MPLARVVSFDGVTAERMQQLTQDVSEDQRPQEIPATEIVMLHDPGANKALVVLFFENEDDYRRGDEYLSAMPTSDTPGQRTSVTKYDVAMRMTA